MGAEHSGFLTLLAGVLSEFVRDNPEEIQFYEDVFSYQVM
ncbi:uncharacterized protein METZ01_LOCUS392920 [marine metagenome]|uniref:Uncharacterized protein n=1 Tax=marine metagenome TaxID=408172 RepID=A0A382V0J3_9ZZZZ